MSAIQYLSAFRLYGWDVLLLAGAVTLLTALLKKTVLKNASRKLYVFLPFALGILLYAVYRGLVTLSAQPFTTDLAATIEGGFGCGCAATLYYVIYEQFFRKRETNAQSSDNQSSDTDAADDTDDAQSAPDSDAAENNSAADGEGNPPDTGNPDTGGTDGQTSDMGGSDAQDADTADTADSDGQTADTGIPITPVAPLLEGYVPEETRLAVAKALTDGARGKTGDALRTFVRETLLSAAPAASEAELAVLTELVAAYLASLAGA